jgi:hypothetical protein
VRKPGRNKQFGRARHECEKNTKLDVKRIAWQAVDWI